MLAVVAVNSFIDFGVCFFVVGGVLGQKRILCIKPGDL